MALNEFELIQKYFHHQANAAGLVLGVGDDCALLDLAPGKSLAVTVDTLVEGVHFPAQADPELVAQRALRVNLSDLAAMGAEAQWFTLALTLPDVNEPWLAALSRGLFDAAHEYSCSLIGGDTTRGPLTITIQMMGMVEQGRALTRAGAQPGDVIYVTGGLGDGAAALAIIQGRVHVDDADLSYFHDRFYRPEPRLKEGALLTGLASAAIDVSDGLLADLGHICTASGVGATIRMEQVPVSPAFARLTAEQDMWQWIMAGGDDYQLCFTVPQARTAEVQALVRDAALDATAIGVIHDQRGITCLYKGQAMTVEQTGYLHFDGT